MNAIIENIIEIIIETASTVCKYMYVFVCLLIYYTSQIFSHPVCYLTAAIYTLPTTAHFSDTLSSCYGWFAKSVYRSDVRMQCIIVLIGLLSNQRNPPFSIHYRSFYRLVDFVN